MSHRISYPTFILKLLCRTASCNFSSKLQRFNSFFISTASVSAYLSMLSVTYFEMSKHSYAVRNKSVEQLRPGYFGLIEFAGFFDRLVD